MNSDPNSNIPFALHPDSSPAPRLVPIRGALLACGLFLLTLAAGCDSPSQPEPPSNPNANAKAEDYPKVTQTLFELAVSAAPAKLSPALGAEYEEGSVTIVIDYRDPEAEADLIWAVEALGGHIQAQATGVLQVRVPLTAVLVLSTHPRLDYVRLPVRPIR